MLSLLSTVLFITGILLVDVKCFASTSRVATEAKVKSADGISSHHSRYIAKRAVSETKCPNGICQLQQGAIVRDKFTNKMIQEEANDGDHDALKKSYVQLSTNQTVKKLYSRSLTNGIANGLSEEETKAIFLYSMDSDGKAFYKDFNKGFRAGEDRYPVFHYWLQHAVDKLPSFNSRSDLYRGNKYYLNATVGDEMALPGFTSVSKRIDAAKDFIEDGCTLQVIRSNLGVDIQALAYNQTEEEVLISPLEKFRVSRITEVDGYPAIYLEPVGRVRRDTSVMYYACCDTSKCEQSWRSEQ